MGFSDTWKRAGDPVDEYKPTDGGHYHVKIVDGGAWVTGDGREFAKATLEIIDGPDTGHRFDDFMNFNNDVGARRARENLALYGLKGDDIETLEDLDTAILELSGTEADVTTKWSPDGRFLNVSVNRVKTGESDIPSNQESFDTSDMQPVPSKGRGAYDDDDIPF
jgi:hypothetical protein